MTLNKLYLSFAFAVFSIKALCADDLFVYKTDAKGGTQQIFERQVLDVGTKIHLKFIPLEKSQHLLKIFLDGDVIYSKSFELSPENIFDSALVVPELNLSESGAYKIDISTNNYKFSHNFAVSKRDMIQKWLDKHYGAILRAPAKILKDFEKTPPMSALRTAAREFDLAIKDILGIRKSENTEFNDVNAPKKEKLFSKSFVPVSALYDDSKTTFPTKLDKLGSSSNLSLSTNAGQGVYRTASKSVVKVIAQDGLGRNLDYGTGFVVEKNNKIITNYHVIQGGKKLMVIKKPSAFETIETAQIYEATVISSDPMKDLALLRINSDIAPPIPIAKPSSIEVAMDVHAIGHPNENNWSYTKGVISQIRPKFGFDLGIMGVGHIADIIQTQTPINPGNSGGPLLNNLGQLVGVNSFEDPKYPSLNYAIAATEVLDFLGKIEEDTEVKSISINKESMRKFITLDRDQDNCFETKAFDMESDKIIERYEIDFECNGLLDLILRDDNADGKVDVKITFQRDQTGEFAIWQRDENSDGLMDLQGFDDDRDGIVDRWNRADKQ